MDNEIFEGGRSTLRNKTKRNEDKIITLVWVGILVGLIVVGILLGLSPDVIL